MKINEKKLKNGLRIVLLPMKNTESVTIKFLIKAGSFNELEKEYGLAHFLEHMCFKGTKTKTYIEISQALDGLGADYNAYTSSEMTSYYAKVRSEKADQALDILSDIYQNSIFPEEEIEKEKGVVIEEIKMYEDNPKSHLFRSFISWVWQDQVAGHDILGTVQSVKSFTRNDLINFYQKHYVPNNTVIAVAGKFDLKKITKKINHLLGDLESKKIQTYSKLKPLELKSVVKTYTKKVEQNHILIGFRAEGEWSKLKPSEEVMQNLLGGMLSSRLFKKVRDELGAAYYIRAGSLSFKDSGIMLIKAGLAKEKLDLVLSSIFAELNILKKELVSDEELIISKENLLGGFYTNLETSDSWASYYGYLELMNQPLDSIKKEEEKIKAVTKNDIKKIAQKIFSPKCVYLATIDEENKDDILTQAIQVLT